MSLKNIVKEASYKRILNLVSKTLFFTVMSKSSRQLKIILNYKSI